MIVLSRLLFRYEFKVLPHGQICTREYLFAYMQICSRVQMWSCERIYSLMQNFLHMQNFIFAPSQDQVQMFVCIYTNFTHMQILSCERKVKFAYIRFIHYVV